MPLRWRGPVRHLPAGSPKKHSPLRTAEHPGEARLVTTDLGHFWDAFERAAPSFSAEPFAKLYFGRATRGLRDFIVKRIGSANALTETIRAHPVYYTSLRESTGRIDDLKQEIRASFYALKYLYPEAVFPDVYFLIGHMSSGGTTSDCALLIGTEMYGRQPDTPMENMSDWHRRVLSPIEALPHIVAHELVHFQQKYDSTNTLLAQSINEGSADFISELISGQHINEKIYKWAEPREEELWRAFEEKMHSDDFSGWLYNGSDARDRPADLGYWMGYQIVQAYYEQAEDKRRAIEDILEIDDFEAFLKKSGYSEKFNE